VSTDPEYLEAFEALPKTNHWLNTALLKHPSATPGKIIETLRNPTLLIEAQFKGRTGYYKYFEHEGIWFRVVLERDGSLLTAFQDDQTMQERGRS
jgi:hypothetical protein